MPGAGVPGAVLLCWVICGVAGGATVSRLQRTLHVCDGLCGNDLPAGVHVSRHPAAPYLHGVSRAGESHRASLLGCPGFSREEHSTKEAGPLFHMTYQSEVLGGFELIVWSNYAICSFVCES